MEVFTVSPNFVLLHVREIGRPSTELIECDGAERENGLSSEVEVSKRGRSREGDLDPLHLE